MLDQNGSYDSRVANQNPKSASRLSPSFANKMPKPKAAAKPAGARIAQRANRAMTPVQKRSGIPKGRARLIDNDNPTNPQSQGLGGGGIQGGY